MSTKRDYYDVLEVGRSASPDELRRAYRRLAKQHHPDVNKEDGSEERFKEINEAYAVLSDEERRASYDRFGHAHVLPCEREALCVEIHHDDARTGEFGELDDRKTDRPRPDDHDALQIRALRHALLP